MYRVTASSLRDAKEVAHATRTYERSTLDKKCAAYRYSGDDAFRGRSGVWSERFLPWFSMFPSFSFQKVIDLVFFGGLLLGTLVAMRPAYPTSREAYKGL